MWNFIKTAEKKDKANETKYFIFDSSCYNDK